MPKISGGGGHKRSMGVTGVHRFSGTGLAKPASGSAGAAGGSAKPADRRHAAISKPFKAGDTVRLSTEQRMSDLTKHGSTKHAG